MKTLGSLYALLKASDAGIDVQRDYPASGSNATTTAGSIKAGNTVHHLATAIDCANNQGG